MVGYVLTHRAVVEIAALYHRHTLMTLRVVHDPTAETGQGGGDAGYAESDALERSISPRLVIRREYCHIETGQQVVIVLVEYAVGPVKICGHEHDAHLTGTAEQTRCAQMVDDGIVAYVAHIVGDITHRITVGMKPSAGKILLQVFPRTEIPPRNQYVGQYLPLQSTVAIEGGQRVDILVEPFVLELVTAAGAYYERLSVELLVERRLGYAYEKLARFTAFDGQCGGVPHHVLFKAVGRYHVRRLTEKMFALLRGDGADSGETIAVISRCGLYGVFGSHSEAVRNIVGIERTHVAVEVHAVAGYASSQYGGMGGEHGGYRRIVTVQVEHAATGHPLMEMGHHLIFRATVESHETLYDLRGRETEQNRLYVIPLTADGIDPVIFPQLL